MTSIKELLSSNDPLTRDAALYLASFNEEDDRVDYKQSFDFSSKKAWLEITKDISAFANTVGGYLVFGISDSDKKVIGLTRAGCDFLKEANNISQKVNPYLDPHITSLRSKEFRIPDASIVVLLIPQSVGKTHLISKVGKFSYPSGEEKVVLREGTFYVRRSASNHLGDSRDLDDVIERRIDQFRDSLMEKVARVVKYPAATDVLIVSKDSADRSGKRFIIEDSPESIHVKGMGFTVTPEGNEQEIASWSALHSGNSHSKPPSGHVWRWYAGRTNININRNYKLDVFQFSLWGNAPYFYWIRGLKAQQIKEALLNALRERQSNDCVRPILTVASFLGERFYNKVLTGTGDYQSKLPQFMQKFPQGCLKETFGNVSIRANKPLNQSKREQQIILNNIAKAALINDKKPGVFDTMKAQKIDCFLYAQDDRYL